VRDVLPAPDRQGRHHCHAEAVLSFSNTMSSHHAV
jgi:hypothetical protein